MKKTRNTIALIILSATLAVAGEPSVTNGQVEIAGRFYYLQPVHHSHWVPALKFMAQCGINAAVGYFAVRVAERQAINAFNSDANKEFNGFENQIRDEISGQINAAMKGAAVHQPGQLAH